MRPFDRGVIASIQAGLSLRQPLLQILVGPRQVGKTTAAKRVAEGWEGPVHYATADLPLPPGPEWIQTHWSLARRDAGRAPLLVLDEVQKVTGWGETVKALWDEDRAHDRDLRVILLGSSALLLAEGTSESLAGRFLLHRCLHWSWTECRAAFGWSLDQWIYFGGYPGAAPLIGDESMWRRYVADSLVETVLSRDVLALRRIMKPTLLRHLFALVARFPAQILSYQKMLGQLQDAGNTTTLADYLRLCEKAFLVTGLERFSAGEARSRGSSPKVVLWNDALVTALGLRSFAEARRDAPWWGRLVENAVGAHLLNHLQGLPYEVTYWRHHNDEVDYVVRAADVLWAIEVKSGLPKRPEGLRAFLRRHPQARPLLVGPGGLPLEEFFGIDPNELLRPGP